MCNIVMQKTNHKMSETKCCNVVWDSTQACGVFSLPFNPGIKEEGNHLEATA